ncbi:tyrosine-type recombinase/integrase [Candidatus Enterococcus murrayae]|uniref:Site-specific integrase n=1 Tax=Candidatus Enterococcus murrayae TaxID=2815321 RepID=A0ABS3HNM9_9ENTE|nr:site-specific integrase [Enterococcus sp. MJM16]MBO0455056.1 site-specific integrase [Enterococcus sp. MJM16]
MARKGENIYKRKDGRWEARYSKGRKENGRILYGSVYGKSYTEAKKKSIMMKAKYVSSMERTISPYIGNLGDWLNYWMTNKVKGQVKETTYSSYQQLIEKHLLPELGNVPLMKIRKKDIQVFLCSLQEKKLAAGTIRNIFTLLKNCLNEAQRLGYILENVCEQITLPKKKQKEISILTLKQQKKLELYAFQDRTCSPIILSLYSGMRIGEISGLKWQDVDFQNNLIHVKRTVSRIVNENPTGPRTKLIEGTPKSANSMRTIPLPPNLKKYLEEKQKAASSEYVVSDTDGLIEPRTITNRFKKTVAAADLSEINFHVLRHTFATRCMEKGIDVASLSKILGHQSTKMTLDTYAGSLMETRRKGMKELDKLFKI